MEALIEHLQRQVARDVGPFVRATASSIPQICDDFTFRELTWALTRDAPLGNPNACLRFSGEIFDNMLKAALCAIAKVYREIIPEGGIGEVLTGLDHTLDDAVEQLQMKACPMPGARGVEKARAAAEKEKAAYAAAAAARTAALKTAEKPHAEHSRPRTPGLPCHCCCDLEIGYWFIDEFCILNTAVESAGDHMSYSGGQPGPAPGGSAGPLAYRQRGAAFHGCELKGTTAG